MSRSCLQSHRASHEVGRVRTRDCGPRQTRARAPRPRPPQPGRPARRHSGPQLAPTARRAIYLLARPRERRKEVARPRAALLGVRGVALANASGSRRLLAFSSTSGTRKPRLFLGSGSTPFEASASPLAPPLRPAPSCCTRLRPRPSCCSRPSSSSRGLPRPAPPRPGREECCGMLAPARRLPARVGVASEERTHLDVRPREAAARVTERNSRVGCPQCWERSCSASVGTGNPALRSGQMSAPQPLRCSFKDPLPSEKCKCVLRCGFSTWAPALPHSCPGRHRIMSLARECLLIAIHCIHNK